NWFFFRDKTPQQQSFVSAVSQPAPASLPSPRPAVSDQTKPESKIADTQTNTTVDLARYLDLPAQRSSTTKIFAVAVASEDGKSDQVLADALIARIRAENIQIETTPFASDFVSDGLFAKVMDGFPGIAKQLTPTNALDALLLARETVGYSQTASLDN